MLRGVVKESCEISKCLDDHACHKMSWNTSYVALKFIEMFYFVAFWPMTTLCSLFVIGLYRQLQCCSSFFICFLPSQLRRKDTWKSITFSAVVQIPASPYVRHKVIVRIFSLYLKRRRTETCIFLKKHLSVNTQLHILNSCDYLGRFARYQKIKALHSKLLDSTTTCCLRLKPVSRPESAWKLCRVLFAACLFLNP